MYQGTIQTREWLEQKYITEQLTTLQIARLVGCANRTIHSWLVKYNIPRRKGGWAKGMMPPVQKKLRSDLSKILPSVKRTQLKKGHATPIEWSIKHSQSTRGDKHHNWHGGIQETGAYVRVYAPNHPCADHNCVKRYRLVMEEHLGRYLLPGEVIHHINGNRHDDRIENLKLMTQSEHAKLHAEMRRNAEKKNPTITQNSPEILQALTPKDPVKENGLPEAQDPLETDFRQG